MKLLDIKKKAEIMGIDLSEGPDQLCAPLGAVTDSGYLVMRTKYAQQLELPYITHWYDSYGAVAMVKVDE